MRPPLEPADLAAGCPFLRGGARPPDEVAAFIDVNREDVVEGRRSGVELICSVLQVAPSTYDARKSRQPSARRLRDAVTGPTVVQLWEANYRDLAAARNPDLVGRDFTATAPDQLWVTDLTCVPTWAGVAYVCFIIDACSRMVVGWRLAPTMRTETVLDAIEMARWSRGAILPGLRCHSDAGSQFTSIRYGERLAEIGATSSIGTVGDSYDNALAETVNGYYKAELIRGPARARPWKTVEDVELATLGWVHWHNHQRLHGYLGDVPPVEFEAAIYADRTDHHRVVGIQ